MYPVRQRVLLSLLGIAGVLVLALWLQKLREEARRSILDQHHTELTAGLDHGLLAASADLAGYRQRLRLLTGLPRLRELVTRLASEGNRVPGSPALHAAKSELLRTFEAVLGSAEDVQRLRLISLAARPREYLRLDKDAEGRPMPAPESALAPVAPASWLAQGLALAPGESLVSVDWARGPAAAQAPLDQNLRLSGVSLLRDQTGKPSALLVVDFDPRPLLEDLASHLRNPDHRILITDARRQAPAGASVADFPQSPFAGQTLPGGLHMLPDAAGTTLIAVTRKLLLGPADPAAQLEIRAGVPLQHLAQEYEHLYGQERQVALALAGIVLALVGLTLAWLRRRHDRQALARLENERALAERLIAQIPVALAMFDSELRFLTVNARYKQLTGLAPGTDLVGQSLFEAIPAAILWQQDFELALAGQHRSAREDPTEGRPQAGQPPTSRRRFLDWAFAPWYTTSGQIGGVIAWIEDVTEKVQEQRRHEEALADSVRKLQAVADAAPVLIAHCDMAGVYRFANRAFAEFLGIPVERIVGRPMAEALDAKVHQKLHPVSAAAHRGESSEHEMDLPPVPGSGATHRFLVRTRPVRDLHGTTTGAVAVFSDITALQEAREALQLSEHRFRTLFEQSPDICLVFTPGGRRILDCNSAAERAFRTTRSALLQMSALDLSAPIQPSGVPSPEALATAASRLGEPDSEPLEWLAMRSDGSHFAVELTGAFAPHGSGRALITLGRDVSQVRQLLAFQSTLIRGAGEAIIATDPSGLITVFNPAAERLFGYAANEAIGKLRLEDLHVEEATAAEPPAAPLGRQSLKSCMAEAQAHGNVTHDWLGMRKDGSRVELLCTLSALRGETGQIQGFLAMARDISERRRLLTNLQDRLEERTTLLEEIHHRVKNNLQIISSLLALQQRQTQDAAVVDQLQVSRDRVAAIAMVHSQLYLGGSLGSIDFGNYAQELLAQILHASGGDSRHVDYAVQGPGFELALGEAVPCALILSELVTNALKHAFPEGHTGRITVELGTSADGAREMVLRDDGIGLPREPGDLREGLGTKLVNRLAAQLNGSLKLDRSPGAGGTAWRLTLPARASTNREDTGTVRG